MSEGDFGYLQGGNGQAFAVIFNQNSAFRKHQCHIFCQRKQVESMLSIVISLLGCLPIGRDQKKRLEILVIFFFFPIGWTNTILRVRGLFNRQCFPFLAAFSVSSLALFLLAFSSFLSFSSLIFFRFFDRNHSV